MQSTRKKLLRYLIAGILLVLIIYFIYRTREVLISFILGAILAYLLYRPVRWIESRGIKRSWSILLIFFILFSILALFLIFSVPRLINELAKLAALIPDYARKFEQISGNIQNMNMPGKLSGLVSENVNIMESFIYKSLKGFIGSIYALLGMVLPVIFSPFLAFYIMNDWEKIRESFLGLLSPQGRNDAFYILTKIDRVLMEFIKGHLLVAAIVGCVAGIAAAIIGVRIPLLIALIVGILDLIPYFGAILGAIPAVAIALSQSWQQGIYMGIAILIIQQVEGNILTPKIMGNKLGMHPLVIIFALLAGGELLGIWGMLVAVPIFAVLRVIISWAYLKLVDSTE